VVCTCLRVRRAPEAVRMSTETRSIAWCGNETSEASVLSGGSSDEELPRQLAGEPLARQADRRGPAVQVKAMRATARMNLAAR
jgi:hypothetical protein